MAGYGGGATMRVSLPGGRPGARSGARASLQPGRPRVSRDARNALAQGAVLRAAGSGIGGAGGRHRPHARAPVLPGRGPDRTVPASRGRRSGDHRHRRRRARQPHPRTAGAIGVFAALAAVRPLRGFCTASARTTRSRSAPAPWPPSCSARPPASGRRGAPSVSAPHERCGTSSDDHPCVHRDAGSSPRVRNLSQCCRRRRARRTTKKAFNALARVLQRPLGDPATVRVVRQFRSNPAFSRHATSPVGPIPRNVRRPFVRSETRPLSGGSALCTDGPS